jgi:ubiquinone/menaquinone biosynthesis C-methylase UbiE
MNNNFNLIAPMYDGLARFVFGKKLKVIQCTYLDRIKPNDKVLIMGGGTGWILEEVLKSQPNVQIDYVDYSSKMIELSKGRAIDYNRVHFIHGDETSIPDRCYDVIICNFFLDVFKAVRLKRVLTQLAHSLDENGILIVSDFSETRKKKHRILIWVMHRFFGLFTKLEAKQLLPIEGYLNSSGFSLNDKTSIAEGLIFSSVYKKASESKL